MKQDFLDSIERAKHSPEYKNYLETRDAVFQMMEHEPKNAFSEPSRYWQEELTGFEYMLDASPLLIKNLRHHCYHLTGIRDWEYRQHHSYHTVRFEQQLQRLKSQDRNGVLVPESPELGGFGYTIDGALYNGDTLRFYGAMLTLDRAGGLDQFRQSRARKMVAEIGAGWGGFAYQFKTLFPNTTYLVVDFPSTILFSSTYLKTVFPNARTLFLTGCETPSEDVQQYDFIFAPHYLWTSFRFERPDLVVNLASFQEMKTKQMEEYVKKAKKWGVPSIYSVNHERNFSNPEMGSVSNVLGAHYVLRDIGLREGEQAYPHIKNAYRELKNVLKALFGRRTKISKRHLFGRITNDQTNSSGNAC